MCVPYLDKYVTLKMGHVCVLQIQKELSVKDVPHSTGGMTGIEGVR